MKKNYWIAVIVSLSLIIDQLTKYIVLVTMDLGQKISIIPSFFYLTSHRNTGAAWGMFDGNKTFLIGVTIIALAIFAYLLKTTNFEKHKLAVISISLLVGGTLGNMIDRLFRSSGVIDFLDFYIFGYDFPIWNVADACLTIGLILYAIHVFFLENRASKPLNDQTEGEKND